MSKISYLPSKDEMLVEFGPVRKEPTKKIGRFRLWLDKKGGIRALAIMPYEEELIEFSKNMHKVKFGGIWRGVRVTDEDIKNARQDLLKRLEGKW
jgi:hypothetical protein